MTGLFFEDREKAIMKRQGVLAFAQKVLPYVCGFLITLLLGIFLLYAAAYLPQKAIDKNVQKSADIMIEEGLYPRLLDKSYGAILDNWSDAIMLMESKTMTAEDLTTVWTNPRFVLDGKKPVESLYGYVHTPEEGRFYSYCRYWMGFRAVLRLTMSFLNYYQMKRYLAFLFFLLFICLHNSISRNVGYKCALSFSVSILLVRPYVICSSLQFSCCFLIAFMGMLFIPWLYRNPKYECLYFGELGMVTMFFDFYTTPLLTFGLPMIYLVLIHASRGDPFPSRRILKNLIIWVVFYGLMWLSKLTLTTLLSPQNAIESGLQSFFGWVGMKGFEKEGGLYDFSATVEKLWQVLTSADREGEFVIKAALFAGAANLVYALCRGRFDYKACWHHIGLLFLAATPIVWFMITAEPTRVHFWFQYRSIAVTFWAIGAYLGLIFEKD